MWRSLKFEFKFIKSYDPDTAKATTFHRICQSMTIVNISHESTEWIFFYILTTEGLHKREAGGRQGVIKCYNNIALAAQPAGAHFIDLVIKCVALFFYILLI